jgi:hypothetical protein
MVMSDQLVYAVVIMVVVMASVACAVLAPTQAPAILGLATLICVQLLALLNGKKTADKVNAMESKVIDVQKVGEATHTLVNSNMGAQLLLSKTALQRIADLTHDQADIQAAETAVRMYAEHQAKQAVVDAGATTPISEGQR